MLRALSAAMVLALTSAAAAEAATEVSTSDRLQDRREVAAGDRAYAVGFADGGWYANGWHITGEMGGIWAPPLKLADGVWFGVDDQWAGAATRFTSGAGYVRYDLPPIGGVQADPHRLRARRPPRRAVRPRARRATRPSTVTVDVDVHSELLTAYPWSSSEGHPTAADNGQDTVAAEGSALAFRDGALTAFAGSDRSPRRPSSSAPASVARAPASSARGRRRRLPSGVRRRPDRPRRRRAPALPRGGRREAEDGVDRRRRHARRPRRRSPRTRTRCSSARSPRAPRSPSAAPWTCRATAASQKAVDYGKQNLADLTQTAKDLNLRFVDRGKAYPRPIGVLEEATFIGAGYPDYPWLFATDGEYTAFAAVALGQFEPIKAHLLALQQVSDRLNAKSGKVAHEIVTDGSVYFGANTDPGNTDESVKFPSAVALVWRWSGDDAFLRRLYDFSRAGDALRRRHPRRRQGRLARGPGQRRARGHGRGEARQLRVPHPRAHRPRRPGGRTARPRHRSAGPAQLATKLLAAFDRTWWNEPSQQYADSLGANNTQLQQQHWIGVTPMETGLAPSATPTPRSTRERRTASAAPPRSIRASSTRAAPADRRARASGSSSASTPRSRPSPTATTDAPRSAATPMRTRRPCSTSSRARCRRSCRHPTRTGTSTAAGRAARCSCRRGATTARRGR